MTKVISPERLSREIVIDAYNLGVLGARIAKLNRRARRLNVAEITYEVIDRGTRPEGDDTVIPTATVLITGETPRLDGWQFIGTIEHLSSGQNLIHGDDARLEAWREADADCGHYNVRRLRKKTVIAEKAETGEIIQVGSTCLKDFFGYHNNPEYLIDWVSDVYDLDGSDGGGRFTSLGWPIEVVLAAALAIVDSEGWVPRSAEGTATADLVEYKIGVYVCPPIWRDLIRGIQITEAHYASAAEHIAWAKAIDPSAPSNYLQNLRTLASEELIKANHLGFVCSIVAAKAQAEEREVIRRQQVEVAALSEWQGTVGGSITTTGKIVGVRQFAGYAYNSPPTYLVTLIDDDGNVFKTFNSGVFGRNAETGETVTIKGTVKKHDTYSNRKETVLTRVKAL